MHKTSALVDSTAIGHVPVAPPQQAPRATIARALTRLIAKLLFVAVIFLVPAVSILSATPAYVTGDTNSCTATSCTANLAATNARDTIILGVFVVNSTSVSSVTDSQGNTFTLINSQTWSSNNFVERLYYAKNIAGGADTITLTLAASAYMELHSYDYSGLDPSSPVDVSATPATGTGTSGTSGSLTTTNANDLLFAFFHSDNDVTDTAGTGFTGRTPTGDDTPLGEDENVSSTGTYSATMSFSGGADYVAFLVAFKAASSGGGGPAYVTGNLNTCTATSCTDSLTGTNAADTIVLGLFVMDSTAVNSVTDTQGNTYNLIVSSSWTGGDGNTHYERLYYAKNIVGGADTITVSLNGSVYTELRAYDYSGLDPSSPVDVSATPATGNSASATSGSLTTTNANDLLFGYFHFWSAVTATPGAGFTGRSLTGDGGPVAEDENVTSTGSYSASMSYSVSTTYVAFFVAFKAASGAGGGGSPAYVTSADNGCNATSCSATLTGTNAGDLIVMGLFVSNSTSVNSVMDSQGNTFTPIGSPQTWSPNNYVERLYYAKNIVGGSDTITVTLTGSATLELLPYDYSGLDPSSPLDVKAVPATGTGTSGTSGSLTTTNANDLLFAFFHSDNDVNNTAGTGFTGRIPAGDTYPQGEDENVTSTGTYSASMSFSGSADYVAFFVAFKAASSGGGGGGGTVSNPSISPSSGSYASPQTITVSDSTSGATICVRTDGGTPTASTPGTCDSPATGYTSGAQFPLTIPGGGATVKAIGTLAGDTTSSVVTTRYSLASAAAAPTFSPGAGTYSSSQTVSISTTSTGAVICWNTTGTPATNGANGCTTGTLYSGPVTVSATETLYAVAGGTGYSDSTISPAAYQINSGFSGWSQTFGYDAYGNVTTSGNGQFQPGYNTNNQMQCAVYDADGNATNDCEHTYSWDAYGRPTAVDGVSITYDAFGRPVEQSSGGNNTEIQYSPTGFVMYLLNGTTVVKAWVPMPAGTALVVTPSTSYYRHADWEGSSRLASTTSRTVYYDGEYAPFGQPYAQSGTSDPNFTGMDQNVASGIYDFPMREYNGNEARWPSPDPGGLASVNPTDPQTWNRYAYVRNSPLMLTDLFGLDPGCFGFDVPGGVGIWCPPPIIPILPIDPGTCPTESCLVPPTIPGGGGGGGGGGTGSGTGGGSGSAPSSPTVSGNQPQAPTQSQSQNQNQKQNQNKKPGVCTYVVQKGAYVAFFGAGAMGTGTLVSVFGFPEVGGPIAEGGKFVFQVGAGAAITAWAGMEMGLCN